MTYAAAGVDVDAGDRAVELMRAAVSATHGPEVVGGFGGFAGMFDASAIRGYDRPLLATSTDGVGTKVAVAQALGIHDTIGYDLVGMVVDDIVVSGARPLFMTDYIACGKVVPERIAAIVRGIAEACAEVGTALVGGETAEHPGLLGPDEYDVAGAAVGVVEADQVLGAERVVPGDVALAIASSGLHSNGFSLVRGVLNRVGWRYDRYVESLGRTIGEEILTPTRLYAKVLLDLLAEPAIGPNIHAFSHVTGGGLASNLARVLPHGLEIVIDRSTWEPPQIFGLLAELGDVPRIDLERTFNMGVGMVALMSPDVATAAGKSLADFGIRSWIMGETGAPSSRGDGDRVQGAKGVDGGAVVTIGSYSTA